MRENIDVFWFSKSCFQMDVGVEGNILFCSVTYCMYMYLVTYYMY